MTLKIHKQVQTRVPRSRLQALFSQVVSKEGDVDWPGEVNLIITDDQHLRSLNRDYRGKDRSTDVLSFQLDNPREADSVFGEIYISLPTAMRQALDHGGSLADELVRLFCHGLLHLFGYDHEKPHDAQIMSERELHYVPGIIEESA